MGFNVILGIAVSIVVVFYLVKALSKPFRSLGKVAARSAVAFFAIWAINVLGGFVGFHLGLNLYSVLSVGLLGLPGAALLVAVKFLL